MSHSRTSTRWTAAVSAWSVIGWSTTAAHAASGALASTPTSAPELQAAWWSSGAALGLAALVFLAATMGVVKLRERTSRQRQRHLEDLVAERTAELGKANAELELLSATDTLTGVANRRAFDDALYGELRRASRGQGESSLLLAQIDHFQTYVDTYGAAAADDCLRRVARTLAALVGRAGDLVARFDGEQFALLLPNTDRHGAATLAERALRAVEALRIPNIASDCSKLVTISVGGASLVALRGHGAEVLVGDAGRALERARVLGRNQFSTYQVEPPARTLRLAS